MQNLHETFLFYQMSVEHLINTTIQIIFQIYQLTVKNRFHCSAYRNVKQEELMYNTHFSLSLLSSLLAVNKEQPMGSGLTSAC